MPSLLKRALELCNRHGQSIAIGVAVFGIAMIVLQAVQGAQVTRITSSTLQSFLGPERFASIEQHVGSFWSGSAESQGDAAKVWQKIQEKLETYPAENRDNILFQQGSLLLGRLLPIILPLSLLLLFIALLSRAYFLVLTVRHDDRTHKVARSTLGFFLKLLGVWIVMALCMGAWLPVIIFFMGFLWAPILTLAIPSFALPILLYPRFVFAPVILVEEGKGIMQSVRESYMRTAGKWWKIVIALAAVSVTLWIVTTLAGAFVQMIIATGQQISPFVGLLAWIFPLFSLIALAYRTAFIVLLKEQMLGKHQAVQVVA